MIYLAKLGKRGRLVISIVLLSIVSFLVLPVKILGDTSYSQDLDDINWNVTKAGMWITPIGDIGDIQAIVDLRGFFPFSFFSKSPSSADILKWYQLPTMWSVAEIYYGDSKDATIRKVSRARILTEDKLSGEALKWAKFSYMLSKSSGPKLFSSAGGWKGELESYEPIGVLLTQRSAIVIINFRYSDIDRKGTGQLLCGYEFSRALKEYKTFYRLRTTYWLKPSTAAAFANSLPYVIKAVELFW